MFHKGIMFLIGLFMWSSMESSLMAGEVYKFIDKNGKVQFGDEPIPGSETITINTSPSQDSSYAERLEKQKKLSEATAADREQTEKAKAQQVAQSQEMESKCKEVKEQLRILDLKRPVYTVDDKGARAYLSDADRSAKVSEYNDMIGQFCK